MPNTILLPPKLYLDTKSFGAYSKDPECQSIGCADKYRNDYIFINQCIKRWSLCHSFFNRCALLEWVEGKGHGRIGIPDSRHIDDTKCIYQSVEDTFTYAWEIFRQCQQIDSSISFPDYDILNPFTKTREATHLYIQS